MCICTKCQSCKIFKAQNDRIENIDKSTTIFEDFDLFITNDMTKHHGRNTSTHFMKLVLQMTHNLHMDIKIFHKTLTSRTHQHVKELHSVTKWGLFQKCKVGTVLKKQQRLIHPISKIKKTLRPYRWESDLIKPNAHSW